MEQVSVYITNLDALPQSILTSLLSAHGIRVLGPRDEASGGSAARRGRPDPGEHRYWDRLMRKIDTHRPDVIICGERNARLARQLSALTDTHVLTLTSRGSSVECRQLRPVRQTLGKMDANDFVALIRRYGKGGDRPHTHARR